MSKPMLSFAGVTHIGGGRENQDTFFTQRTDSGVYLGVFDGHGEFGARVAELAANTLRAAGPAAASQTGCAEAFGRADELCKPAILGAAQRKYGAHGDYRQELDGRLTRTGMWGQREALRGGTTATVLSVEGLQLNMAHVGDSEVLVVHESGLFVVLTKDHSCNSLEEFQRLREQRRAVPRIEFDSGGFAPVGEPPRPVFVRGPDGNYQANQQGGFYYSNVRKEWASYIYASAEDKKDALAMTRALGDFHMKRAGVSADPDFMPYGLPAEGRSWVIAASDGLYDNYTYEELAALVQLLGSSGLGAEQMAERLLALVLERGFKNFGAGGQDNTTICVVAVEPQPSVSLRLPLMGGATLCKRITPAAALRLAVGRSMGLTLCDGVLAARCAPLSWAEARRFAEAAV